MSSALHELIGQVAHSAQAEALQAVVIRFVLAKTGAGRPASGDSRPVSALRVA